MKNNKTIWFSVVLATIFYAGSQMPVYGSPIFSPADDEPIAKSAEKKSDSAVEAPQQNTSTENANLYKGTTFALSVVHIKVLSGLNRAGEKSYSSTYQLAEVAGKKNPSEKEPEVTVSFKNKLDKGKFAVAEVVVKKLVNNAYKITAKIVDLKPGETPKGPKVIWVD